MLAVAFTFFIRKQRLIRLFQLPLYICEEAHHLSKFLKRLLYLFTFIIIDDFLILVYRNRNFPGASNTLRFRLTLLRVLNR